MTPLLFPALIVLTLLVVGIAFVLTAPESKDLPAPIEAQRPAPGCSEIPDFTIGFWDGWQWAEAGHGSYTCHGDWFGKDKDYWRGFHRGYREFCRTEEKKP